VRGTASESGKMKGLATLAALLAGGLLMTALLAGVLQQRAGISHPIDGSYRPPSEVPSERWGLPDRKVSPEPGAPEPPALRRNWDMAG
jgi:hypothetical protein